MAWWGRYTKKSDAGVAEIISGHPGECIPCNNPQTAVVAPPVPEPDPEPNMETKPKDKIGYCFGFACPKKHVHSPFESTTADDYKNRRVCPVCGGVSKPCTVKRTAEAQWGDCAYPSWYDRTMKPDWRWYNSYINGFGKSLGLGDIFWTKYEFIRFLDNPKTRRKK